MFQNKEADIVYKLKQQNIFFLIEHQTKVDYSMPYRILDYEMQIIKSAVDIKQLKNKSYKMPLIVPIVLYTGKQKWNADKNLEEKQEKMEELDIKLSNYNLVDINNFTNSELLEDDTLISKIMLLEKSKNTEDIVMFLEKIVPKIKDEDKEIITRIINLILSEKLGNEQTKKFIEKLKGDDKKMLAVIEMIQKENKMYINIGRKERNKRTGKEKIN